MRLPAGITREGQLPRVDILYSYPGADGIFAEAAVKAGAKALVIAGYPTGAVPPALRDTLIRLRDAGTVVIHTIPGLFP